MGCFAGGSGILRDTISRSERSKGSKTQSQDGRNNYIHLYRVLNLRVGSLQILSFNARLLLGSLVGVLYSNRSIFPESY